MKVSCLSFAHLALLAAGTAASFSPFNIPLQAQEGVDEIDLWLAEAQRVSSEALKACPVSCSGVKNNTSSAEWFLFPDVMKLASCNETMLLDMNVQAQAGEPTSQSIVRACTADFDSGVTHVFSPDENKASLCTTANRKLKAASVYMHQPTIKDNTFSVNHVLAATRQISHHLALQSPSCTSNAMEFAYSQSAVVGLFAGAELHQHGVTTDLLEKLLKHIQENVVSKSTIVQLCGSDGLGADYSIGAVVTSSENLAFAQAAVKTWANGGCVSQADAGAQWMEVTLRIPVPTDTNMNNGTNAIATSNGTSTAHLDTRFRLVARADCKTATVQAGDGCWAVANRCGISQADLEKYNRANLCTTLIKEEKVCCGSGTLPSTLPNGNSDGTCKTRSVVSGDSCDSLASKCGISRADFNKVNTKTNLCLTLAPSQNVCCTDGKLPNFKPKPDASGNCATYTTKKDDSCSAIAASRDLSVLDIESYNKKTWGWNGCDLLFTDFKMCVSSGSPPMPANVPVSQAFPFF